MDSESTIPAIEHQHVPIEHRGLHDFLYSSGDEHGLKNGQPSADLSRLTAQNEGDSGAGIMPLEEWCARAGTAKVAGVYGVLDCDRQLQYVNISRHVSLSLRGHQQQLGAEHCAFVRVATFSFPKREDMAALQAAWIAENGVVPIGNREGDSPWTRTTGEGAIAVMSPAERAAYEEKKLKLRKAMADSSLSREQPLALAQDVVAQDREPAADDWSAVIRSQTQDTL